MTKTKQVTEELILPGIIKIFYNLSVQDSRGACSFLLHLCCGVNHITSRGALARISHEEFILVLKTKKKLQKNLKSIIVNFRYKVMLKRFWAVQRGLNRPLEDERNIERRQSKHILLMLA